MTTDSAKEPCPDCCDTGQLEVTETKTCEECDGSGEVLEAPCEKCAGSGTDVITTKVACSRCFPQ